MKYKSKLLIFAAGIGNESYDIILTQSNNSDSGVKHWDGIHIPWLDGKEDMGKFPGSVVFLEGDCSIKKVAVVVSGGVTTYVYSMVSTNYSSDVLEKLKQDKKWYKIMGVLEAVEYCMNGKEPINPELGYLIPMGLVNFSILSVIINGEQDLKNAKKLLKKTVKDESQI